jgi:ribosomal protein L40E
LAILGVFLRDPSPQPGVLYPAYPPGAWPPIPPPPPPPPVGTLQRTPMSQSIVVNLPPSAIPATQPTNASVMLAAAIPYANPLPPPPPEDFTRVPKPELVSSMCRKCGAPLPVGDGACLSCGFS